MALDKEILLKTKGQTGALPLNQILENIIDEVNGDDWINLSLEDGVSVGTIGGTPQYRKVGNRVHVRGGFKFTASNSNIVFARLPVGFRPTQNFYVIGSTGGARVGRTCITNGGAIVCDWIYDLGTSSRFTGNVDWYNVNFDFLVD